VKAKDADSAKNMAKQLTIEAINEELTNRGLPEGKMLQEAVAVAKPVLEAEPEEEKELSNNMEALAIGLSCGLGVVFLGGLLAYSMLGSRAAPAPAKGADLPQMPATMPPMQVIPRRAQLCALRQTRDLARCVAPAADSKTLPPLTESSALSCLHAGRLRLRSPAAADAVPAPRHAAADWSEPGLSGNQHSAALLGLDRGAQVHRHRSNPRSTLLLSLTSAAIVKSLQQDSEAFASL